MSDTPFEAPAPEAGSSVSTDKLPSAVDLVSESFKEFMDDVGPMALAGLGITVVGVSGALILMVLGFGCMFGGMFGATAIMAGGGATGDEALAGLSAGAGMLTMLGAYLGFFVIVFVGGAVITAPFNASLNRALDKHLRGGPKVGFGSAFDTAFQQPVQDIMAHLGMMVSILIGAFALYIGALFAVFFLKWWPLYVALDGKGFMEGAGLSFSHSKDNLTWHLGVFGLSLVIGMVGGYVPILGPMFGALYQVKAYRAAVPAAADPDILD